MADRVVGERRDVGVGDRAVVAVGEALGEAQAGGGGHLQVDAVRAELPGVGDGERRVQGAAGHGVAGLRHRADDQPDDADGHRDLDPVDRGVRRGAGEDGGAGRAERDARLRVQLDQPAGAGGADVAAVPHAGVALARAAGVGEGGDAGDVQRDVHVLDGRAVRGDQRPADLRRVLPVRGLRQADLPVDDQVEARPAGRFGLGGDGRDARRGRRPRRRPPRPPIGARCAGCSGCGATSARSPPCVPARQTSGTGFDPPAAPLVAHPPVTKRSTGRRGKDGPRPPRGSGGRYASPATRSATERRRPV